MTKVTALEVAAEMNNINVVCPFLANKMTNDSNEDNVMIEATINALKRYNILLQCLLSGTVVYEIPDVNDVNVVNEANNK